MKFNFSSRRRWTAFALATVASVTITPIVSARAQDAPVPAQTGILETSAGTYAFTPTTCGIYKEDDFYDIEIMGPGTAPDGERFHFELTSTGNEMSIQLGADGPFQTSERQIRAGQHVSGEFSLDVSGRIIRVNDLALVDERSQSIDTSASLQINCSLQ